MNSHNHFDDVIDLSLERSLKNWVDGKTPPTDLRAQLLAEAARSKPIRKRRRTVSFVRGWSLLSQGNQQAFVLQPLYGYTFIESVFSLKASMAVF